MGEIEKRTITRILTRMKPILGRALVGLVILIRLGLGAIFIYSSVGKIMHPQDFLATVYDFRLTGPALGLLVAIALPWFELLLGLALLIGIFPGGALLAASALGALFLLVQASAILRGISVSCGCFGPDEAHMVGLVSFLRTLLIFLAAVAAWLWHYRYPFSQGSGTDENVLPFHRDNVQRSATLQETDQVKYEF